MADTDTIRLDVAASSGVLPIVRMIVGGVGARLDLSLDDLEDIYLALEELICAADDAAEGPRLTITVKTAENGLTVDTGPFRSTDLRRRLTADGGPSAGLNLATLFARVVESLAVRASDGDRYFVSFGKRRGGMHERHDV